MRRMFQLYLFIYGLSFISLTHSEENVTLRINNLTLQEGNFMNIQPDHVTLELYNVTLPKENLTLKDDDVQQRVVPLQPYNVTLPNGNLSLQDDDVQQRIVPLQPHNVSLHHSNITKQLKHISKFHHGNGTLHFGNITLLLNNATYRQDQGQMLTEYNMTFYGNVEPLNTVDDDLDSDEAMMKPTYWLYTRETLGFEKQLDRNPGYYWNIDMIGVKERDTKILIHGWSADRFSKFSTGLKNTFLKEMDVNVILVDWSLLADQSYHTAKDNIAHTALYIGNFLKYLVDQHGMDLDRMHIIGFGLGAHLAGLSSKTLAPKKVYAITGLDPVSRLSHMSHTKRLARTDAKYVEVIHTGARRFLGSYKPLGHADFYPNGGRIQPGCGLDLTATCSGERALELYKASLEARGPVFWGVKCKTQLEAVQSRCHSMVHAAMGGKKIMRSYGIYYLQTKAKPPYY